MTYSLPRNISLPLLATVLLVSACASKSEPILPPPLPEPLPEPVVDMPMPPSEILDELKRMQQRWDSARQARLQLLTPLNEPSPPGGLRLPKSAQP